MKHIFTKLLVILLTVFLSSSANASGFKLPSYEKVILDNGLTIYLMEQHEVPLINVASVFPAGAVSDGEKNGLASLTADSLLFGTSAYTKSDIEQTLDFLGASFGTSASLESASVSMSFMKKDTEKCLNILKEIIVSPVFDQTEFEKRKSRLVAELKQAKEQPSSVMMGYFNRFMFGSDSYGNPVSGTISGVESITRDDVITFYKSHYIPSESAIAIVGDFNTETMKQTISKLMSGWTSDASYTRPVHKIPEINSSRVLLVNKDDATETRFIIGAPGITQSNPDYVAVDVVNTILGGRFTSWLNDELRVNRGLTYGARSMFSRYKDSGAFIAYSYTRTEKTEEALDVTLEVINRLHTKGIDADTLESAKNYVKGQFPPEFETSGSLAYLLTSMFAYGYNESFINTFENKVDALTTETVKEIINTYFPQKNFQCVLIGKADSIRDIAKKYGTLTEKDIKAEGF